MKKYSREDQITMAAWAAGCAERVLPPFEGACPEDGRPRSAIEACRGWVRTGVFRMAEIRGASLGAHAAARDVGQAVGDRTRPPARLRGGVLCPQGRRGGGSVRC